MQNLRPRAWRRMAIAAGVMIVGALVPWAVTSTAAGASPAAAHSAGGRWVATWGASPQEAVTGALSATGFDNQTIRNIVFTSVGGNAVRLELTNTFGAGPLEVGRVTVAVAGAGAAVVPGTVHGRLVSVVGTVITWTCSFLVLKITLLP